MRHLGSRFVSVWQSRMPKLVATSSKSNLGKKINAQTCAVTTKYNNGFVLKKFSPTTACVFIHNLTLLVFTNRVFSHPTHSAPASRFHRRQSFQLLSTSSLFHLSISIFISTSATISVFLLYCRCVFFVGSIAAAPLEWFKSLMGCWLDGKRGSSNDKKGGWWKSWGKDVEKCKKIRKRGKPKRIIGK